MQLNFHPTVIQLCGALISEVLLSDPQSLTWQHLGQLSSILVDEIQQKWDPHLVNELKIRVKMVNSEI